MEQKPNKKESLVTREDREKLNRQKSFVIWITGLPGSGKSTLAKSVERELHGRWVRAYILEEDTLRQGINKYLGNGAPEQSESTRRMAELARLFVDAGIIVIAVSNSPFARDRDLARSIIGDDDYLEVYAKCPLGVCEARDTTGRYRKARAGELPNFPGIAWPYEVPEKTDVTADTWDNDVDQCTEAVLWGLHFKGKLK